LNITEIEAKSILRKYKKIDSWFISHYGMNLYRGCSHNCAYCDGRAEGYYVEGEFGKDVAVKINGIEILARELDPARKRRPFKQSFIMAGGGVGDSYQPAEEKYQLSRKVLQLLYKYNFPVHVLTKSTLIMRDMDILKNINEQRKAVISFSFSSVDNRISSIFEPGVPPPAERLKTLALFKEQGFACGMFLMPVIPFVTDTKGLIEQAVKRGAEIGVDFIIFSGMTLKQGRQQEYFLNTLKSHYPEMVSRYRSIYRGDRWGQAATAYYHRINRIFSEIADRYKIPKRMPLPVFRDILSENDLVIVLLEHINYLLKLQGGNSPFGYAAYSISKLKEPLSEVKEKLLQIRGVNRNTQAIILEILDTGSSAYYRKLAAGDEQ